LLRIMKRKAIFGWEDVVNHIDVEADPLDKSETKMLERRNDGKKTRRRVEREKENDEKA